MMAAGLNPDLPLQKSDRGNGENGKILDLLYHGPRNDLPEGYAPKGVIKLLNDHADELLCVRGNCEAEVDQMVLRFPVMAEYALLSLGYHMIYMTHGHHANEQNPPLLKPGDYLLCGHTHVPKCMEHDYFTYLNPGSISIPKEDSPRSDMIFDEKSFGVSSL
ncbi:MAG: phosphodiesterase [Blautia sp.]|nr:phosphodiesterase [Blautia sp.]